MIANAAPCFMLWIWWPLCANQFVFSSSWNLYTILSNWKVSWGTWTVVLVGLLYTVLINSYTIIMPTTNIILLTFQLLLTVLNSGLLDGATIGRPIVEDETTPATTTTTTTTYCPWVKYGCAISMYVICTITNEVCKYSLARLLTYLFTKIRILNLLSDLYTSFFTCVSMMI